MIITCLEFQEIAYPGKDGNTKKVNIRPGSYDYPMLDHKEPMVAEQLRVLRKHSRIGFDEILETDRPVLAAMPKDEPNKAKKLLEETGIKPSPVGREVKGSAKRTKKTPRSARKASKKGDKDQIGWGVLD